MVKSIVAAIVIILAFGSIPSFAKVDCEKLCAARCQSSQAKSACRDGAYRPVSQTTIENNLVRGARFPKPSLIAGAFIAIDSSVDRKWQSLSGYGRGTQERSRA
jgi:hypothetical protein